MEINWKWDIYLMLSAVIVVSNSNKLSVFWNEKDGKYDIQTGMLNNTAVACAEFANNINKTG